MNLDTFKQFLSTLKIVKVSDRTLFTSEHATVECLTLDDQILYGLVIDKHTGQKYRISALVEPLPAQSDTIDLELDEDFIEKSYAICNHLEYDKNILVPIDLSDEDIQYLKDQANQRGITVDQLVNEILRKSIEE